MGAFEKAFGGHPVYKNLDDEKKRKMSREWMTEGHEKLEKQLGYSPACRYTDEEIGVTSWFNSVVDWIYFRKHPSISKTTFKNIEMMGGFRVNHLPMEICKKDSQYW